MEEEKDIISEPTLPYGKSFTYGDYLKFNFDYMVELIRGKIYKMSPSPSRMHQTLSSNLYLQIGGFFKNKSCFSFYAPFDVVLSTTKDEKEASTVVQPDIGVVCDSSKISDKACIGAPDWVIEIISPHTSKKDIQLKFNIYEEAGVREYWVAFPIEKVVEIFVLDNGKYRRVGMYTEEDVIHPQIFPELEVNLGEAFDYPIYPRREMK